MLDAAGAFGVFAQDGVYFGQQFDEAIKPVTILKVEGEDGSLWLDWSVPQAKPVVTPGLAYLMNSSLDDDTARSDVLRNSNVLNIGRPAAVKLGQTDDGLDAWTIGYSHRAWSPCGQVSVKSPPYKRDPPGLIPASQPCYGTH